MVCGDSVATVPAWVGGGMGGEGGELFDHFFVDGNHTTEHALADLRNACAESKVGGIVALDDCTQIDVAVAWDLAVKERFVEAWHHGVCWEDLCWGRCV